MADESLNLYISKNESQEKLALKMANFDGPFDLLLYLIGKHKIDIYDIPIKELTDSYFAYLQAARDFNVAIASEFLLMAATLMQIKSRLLLPLNGDDTQAAEDPRDDLVFRLLQYKRCKQLALSLQDRYAAYAYAVVRPPLSKRDLGADSERKDLTAEQCRVEKFYEIIAKMARRNGEMYQNLSEKLRYILAREKVSLQERLQSLYQKVCERKKLYFSEFLQNAGKESKITGFLALLELIRRQLVIAGQDNYASDIVLTKNETHELQDTDISDVPSDYQ